MLGGRRLQYRIKIRTVEAVESILQVLGHERLDPIEASIAGLCPMTRTCSGQAGLPKVDPAGHIILGYCKTVREWRSPGRHTVRLSPCCALLFVDRLPLASKYCVVVCVCACRLSWPAPCKLTALVAWQQVARGDWAGWLGSRIGGCPTTHRRCSPTLSHCLPLSALRP